MLGSELTRINVLTAFALCFQM